MVKVVTSEPRQKESQVQNLWLNTHSASLDDYEFPLRQELELFYDKYLRQLNDLP